MKNTQHLSFRIAVAIWTVCAVILLVFGLFFYGLETRQREIQIEQAKVLLSAVYQQKREELANEIFAGHVEALKRTLSEIQAVKGIGALHVFDLDGELLRATGQPSLPAMTADKCLKQPQETACEQVRLTDPPGILFGTKIEMIGEDLGFFSAFFDLSDLHRASRERILLIVAVFSLLLVVLTMVMHTLMKHTVIAPVSEISKAMGHVMQGRLGEKVDVAVRNEIGEVAEAFNAMSLKLKEQHQHLTQSMETRNSYARRLEETNRKLARLNADLESIVEERTRELRTSYEKLQNEIHERIRADQEKHTLEERLARLKKMEALGLLAGGVAHDLNNVLSGIVSYPELILMDIAEGHPIRPLVESIQQSGQKAAAIVEDLLALARRGVTNMMALNLNSDIISDYLSSPECRKLRSYYPNVSIETDLSPDLMNIQGSAVHLRKALMNLVANAAESQPEGGRILISTHNRYVDRPISGYDQVNEGDYVLLRVEDKGSGIDPEDMDRIFEPFYTKKVMGRSGTGLGMAVVWGTVQDHKGYINVKSCVGKGTRFELYFPVTREKTACMNASISLEDYMGRGEHVLVIDDVREQREIVHSLLERLNYKVDAVSSGEEAVAFLKEKPADILVLDMIMDPGMDGLETYEQILDIRPLQKAIIASGYAENQRVKRAQELGAGCYLRKPYSIEKIAVALRTEIERSENSPKRPAVC